MRPIAEQNSFFVITTFTELKEDANFGLTFGSVRTVGVYPTMDEARDVVETNECDLFETIYDYALIEELTYGLYPVPERLELYKVKNPSQGRNVRYQKIDLPDKFPPLSISIG